MTAPIERLRAVLAAATPGTRLERIAAARVRGAETWGDGKTLVKDDVMVSPSLSRDTSPRSSRWRLYEMTTRRDSDDADPQVWDRVLIHGASATREQIGV